MQCKCVFWFWKCYLNSWFSFLWQAQTNSANLEKKQKKFDQQINEWKLRCDELQAEVDNAQKEARNYSTEVSQHIGQALPFSY